MITSLNIPKLVTLFKYNWKIQKNDGIFIHNRTYLINSQSSTLVPITDVNEKHPVYVLCKHDLVSKRLACLSHQYECADQSCISIIHVCNGINDCEHGEDEIDCNLSKSEYYTCTFI